MAYIAPDSTINLYSGVQIIPGRQLAFSSKANQTAYFARKLTQSYTPCTYVRRTNSVKAEVSMAVVKGCNYISFTNPSFENVTWYAKILNYEYVNNGCTQIFYAIDYFQTFMFDVSFETCTIDREQLSVDDYDKSVTNPYDYSVIELQTDENISLPENVFAYPELTGQKSANAGKRTFMPGGYEDASAEKIADNTMMYTIVMSSPLTEIVWGGTGDWNAVVGTMTKEDLQEMFELAGFARAKSEYLYTTDYLPIGNNVRGWREISGGTTNITYKGVSWVDWDPDSPLVTPADGYGYGCFGLQKNNVDNQTLILATSSYNSMSRILNIIAKNDIVSSIVGCYMLPLSFLCMLHAQTFDKPLSISYTPLANTGTAPDGKTLNDNENKITLFKEEIAPIGFNEVKNKKLLTFPYQYIRVTAPDGTKKEYHFEDFTSLQSASASGQTPEDNFKVMFTLLADITNTPLLEMYPYLYKLYSSNENNNKMSFRKKLNIEERMEFSDFPQQAYMTDAYLAYVANQYSEQTLLNPHRENLETAQYHYKYNKEYAGYEELSNAAAVSVSPITQGIAALKAPFDGAQSLVDVTMGKGSVLGKNAANEMWTASRSAELQAEEKALNLRSEAANWADTGEIGSALSSAKPAFRMNNYKAGGGSGILPYFMSGFKFTFDVMKLKPAFLQKFDEYFTNYGYKSTATRVPHIATYLNGTKTGDAPKFLQNAQGYYVTYIKTVDCKVYSNMDLVTDFFETLFNMGIQLIDGDTLL